MEIEYELHLSIHDVCSIREIRAVGERLSARLDLDMVTDGCGRIGR